MYQDNIGTISDADNSKLYGLTQFGLTNFNPATATVWLHNDRNTNNTATGLSEGFHIVRARAFLPRTGKSGVFNTFSQAFYYDAQPPAGVIAFPSADNQTINSSSYTVVVRADGTLGAFMGFESRVSSGRSVVAMVGSDPAAADSLVNALDDDSKVPSIRGELAIVRNGDIQSFQSSSVYFVGSLSWWQWLWFHFSRHALLLTLISLAAAVAAGLFLYGSLQRIVTKRLESRKKD